jgi:hypothetical protein
MLYDQQIADGDREDWQQAGPGVHSRGFSSNFTVDEKRPASPGAGRSSAPRVLIGSKDPREEEALFSVRAVTFRAEMLDVSGRYRDGVPPLPNGATTHAEISVVAGHSGDIQRREPLQDNPPDATKLASFPEVLESF